MSRLIVKNLPKNMTPERLREVFSTRGQVTDCNLKYTRDGAFRQFAFIGYHSNDQCAAAIAHFHNSFIDTSKIQVAPAYDLGDTNKPRSWSKYSAESSSYINKQKAVSHPGANTEDSTDKKEKKKKKRNKEEKMKELLGDLYDNPEFLEFLEAHKLSGKGAKTMWSNDTIECLKETFKGAEKHPGVVFDDDDDDDSGNESEDTTTTTTTTPTTTANKAHHDQSASKDSDTELEDSKATTTPTPTVKYSVRMKGLKGRFHNDTIKEFFHPLKLKQVHIPRGLNHKQFGVVFAEFFSAEDVKLAMERQGKFICGCQITLKESTTSGSCYDNDNNNNNSAGLEKTKVDNSIVPEDEEEEELSESGRLFIRNLPYTCTEEDLEKHFSKYGALTEVYLPQDPHTNKLRGFAFVTFLIPETAVKVLAEMDGTSFQGRLLHILPSRIKKDRENKEDSLANSSYKTKNLQKKKSQAQSSHNWNALFLGSNAVADVLSDKYGISKSDLLDIESSDSLGVRMALGETQIVSETREFLLENGVALDSFSQSSGPRSKTVILVKNLPAGCHGDAVAKVFSRHGTLGRVIFPPSAITAIVEFISPADAKRAFTNLAYTKFQHLPLYLEWAPQQTFVNPTPPPPSAPAQEGSKSTAESTEQAKPRDDDEEEEDSDVEPDSVMFVKNLTLDTTEDDLTQVFQSCGPIRNVMVARKKDLKNQGQVTSMGYAFVEFKKSSSADKAIKTLQRAVVDGRQVELKISNRRTLSDKVVSRQKQVEKKQKTSKILVRNIPFQANKREIQQLFSVFGELKVVRLPKKVTGTGSHRGFAFVDFVNRKDAKKAFTSLCHSTHLYGRRLVLEWAQLETDLAGALSGLEGLRKRTADHYHDDSPKKSRKSDIVASLTD
ncbi:probable RNA-binding protein 19 [Argonauta hians]